MGNSIVRTAQASSDKREFNNNVAKAVENGATHQDATRQELERRGVVFNDNGQPATGGGSSGGTFISGAFDESGDLQLNRYIGGVKQHESATALFSNIAGSDLVGLRDIHNSLLDFAGRDLSSNLGLLNVSRNFYDARVEQQVYESSLLSRDQYYRNRRYAIGNANAQYQQAKFETSVRGNGRVIDLNDDATRARVAGGIAAQTKAELTNIALGIASLPLLAVGGGVLGSLAFRGAQVGIRGVQATSRAVTSFTDDVARLGAVNAIGLRAPTATIYGAEALAGLSEGGIYAASFGSVATGAIRYGDDIVDAVGFGNRISGSATGPTLRESTRATFQNGIATNIVLEQPLTVYRTHGGNAGKVGRFTTLDIFNSRVDARNSLALLPEWGNSITKLTTVDLPRGTPIWFGQAAQQVGKNGSILPGGGNQIFIDGQLDSNWFRDTVWFRSDRSKN